MATKKRIIDGMKDELNLMAQGIIDELKGDLEDVGDHIADCVKAEKEEEISERPRSSR